MNDAASQPSLKRALGLGALTFYGIGNMLGAGIYGLVGKVAGAMGNAMWMAFAVSMVAAALTGLSYACLGSRYPRAAGAAFITQRAFGRPMLTYILGLTVMASGLTSMATASRVFAEYAGPMLAPAGPWITPAMIAAAFLIGLCAVNLWGIRQAAWVNILCTAVEAAGLLFVIAVGARFWGSADLLDASSPANPAGRFALPLLLQASVLTFFAFIGFEDLLNVSEEVKNPRRTFPLALVLALGIVTLIYMGVAITAASVVPADQFAAGRKTLVEVVRRAAPWFPAGAFAGVALFAVTNTALLNYIMGSRLAYGMARQGLLPRWLGAVHPRRHTPHLAIVSLLGVVLALALAGDISALATTTSLLLLCSFCLVNLGLVRLRHRPGEPRGGFEVPRAIPILGALVCAALVVNDIVGRAVSFARALSTDGFVAACSHLVPLALGASLVLAFALLYLALRPTSVEVEG